MEIELDLKEAAFGVNKEVEIESLDTCRSVGAPAPPILHPYGSAPRVEAAGSPAPCGSRCSGSSYRRDRAGRAGVRGESSSIRAKSAAVPGAPCARGPYRLTSRRVSPTVNVCA